MSNPVLLTEEEEKEFTLVNGAAFDLLRVTANEKGSIPPCWLCMSAEAKEEARQTFYRWLDDRANHLLPFNEETATALLEGNRHAMSTLIARWRDAEVHYKELRSQGIPQAFFAK